MTRARIAALLLATVAFCASAEEDGKPPFITTPSDVVERMLRLAGAGPSDLVVDLGSGDGRIVIDAARKFGARGLGIELDERLVAESRIRVRDAKLADRVSIVHGDVLRVDFSQASIVTVYLLPFLINRLQSRFLDELAPGTRVVSHAFQMTGWKPDHAETMRIAQAHQGQGAESVLFLWVVPAKARGAWEGGAWRLRIQQNFQEVEVEASEGGRPVGVTRASLSGRELDWEGRDVQFKGRIEGARITGELTRQGRSTPLELRRQN